MYAISLSPDLSIEVSVRTAGSGQDSRETLNLTKLSVESPIWATTRAVLPLVMELPLSQPQARLRVFYDTDGCAAHAELLPAAGAPAQLRAVGVERFQPATLSTTLHAGRPGYAEHFAEENRSRV